MPINELDHLYSGEIRVMLVRTDGSMTSDVDVTDAVVLPGSFNPLHRGHVGMLEAASEITGRRGVFEISIANVDKPDLAREELERRLEQFRNVADVAVTRAPLFSDKATLLKGAWFALGYDTATRLVADRYYPAVDAPRGPGGPAAAHLGELQARCVRFVVAGRADSNGVFRGLANLEIPEGLEDMFIEIPEARFREDVSSTALREGRKP